MEIRPGAAHTAEHNKLSLIITYSRERETRRNIGLYQHKIGLISTYSREREKHKERNHLLQAKTSRQLLHIKITLISTYSREKETQKKDRPLPTQEMYGIL
jgi:hypothetical protein